MYRSGDYSEKLEALQARLRKSEEEKHLLKAKLDEVIKKTNTKRRNRMQSIRDHYDSVFDEHRERSDRNESLLRALESVDGRAASLAAKTERMKVFKTQYEAYLTRVLNSSIKPPHSSKHQLQLAFSETSPPYWRTLEFYTSQKSPLSKSTDSGFAQSGSMVTSTPRIVVDSSTDKHIPPTVNDKCSPERTGRNLSGFRKYDYYSDSSEQSVAILPNRKKPVDTVKQSATKVTSPDTSDSFRRYLELSKSKPFVQHLKSNKLLNKLRKGQTVDSGVENIMDIMKGIRLTEKLQTSEKPNYRPVDTPTQDPYYVEDIGVDEMPSYKFDDGVLLGKTIEEILGERVEVNADPHLATNKFNGHVEQGVRGIEDDTTPLKITEFLHGRNKMPLERSRMMNKVLAESLSEEEEVQEIIENIKKSLNEEGIIDKTGNYVPGNSMGKCEDGVLPKRVDVTDISNGLPSENNRSPRKFSLTPQFPIKTQSLDKFSTNSQSHVKSPTSYLSLDSFPTYDKFAMDSNSPDKFTINNRSSDYNPIKSEFPNDFPINNKPPSNTQEMQERSQHNNVPGEELRRNLKEHSGYEETPEQSYHRDRDGIQQYSINEPGYEYPKHKVSDLNQGANYVQQNCSEPDKQVTEHQQYTDQQNNKQQNTGAGYNIGKEYTDQQNTDVYTAEQYSDQQNPEKIYTGEQYTDQQNPVKSYADEQYTFQQNADAENNGGEQYMDKQNTNQANIGEQYSNQQNADLEYAGQQYTDQQNADLLHTNADYTFDKQYTDQQNADAEYTHGEQNTDQQNTGAEYTDENYKEQQKPNSQYIGEQYTTQQNTGEEYTDQLNTVEEYTNQENTGAEYIGEEYTGQQNMGAEYAGEEYTDQQNAVAEYTDQQNTGAEYTGEKYTDQQIAGAEYTGEKYTDQQIAGAEYTDQQNAGAEYTHEEYTDQQNAGAEYTGEEYTDQQNAGAEYTDQQNTGGEYTGEQYTDLQNAGAVYTGAEYTDQQNTGAEYTGEEYTDQQNNDPQYNGAEQYTDQQYTSAEYTGAQSVDHQNSDQVHSEAIYTSGEQYTDQQNGEPNVNDLQYDAQQMPDQQHTADAEYAGEYPDQQYTDQQYTDQQYTDQQYTDQQYTDQQYTDKQYAGQDYSDQPYVDQRGVDPTYIDPQYAEQPYGDQQGGDPQYAEGQYTDEQLQEYYRQQQSYEEQENVEYAEQSGLTEAYQHDGVQQQQGSDNIDNPETQFGNLEQVGTGLETGITETSPEVLQTSQPEPVPVLNAGGTKKAGTKETRAAVPDGNKKKPVTAKKVPLKSRR